MFLVDALHSISMKMIYQFGRCLATTKWPFQMYEIVNHSLAVSSCWEIRMGWTQLDCQLHRSQMTWSHQTGPIVAVANYSTGFGDGRQETLV